MSHKFSGKWITSKSFAKLHPIDVFGMQERKEQIPDDENKNSHILFRSDFYVDVDSEFEKAEIFISADDYYMLYINGDFAAMGPAPSYHNAYNYNVIDIRSFLEKGHNNIAIHTYYQGLINRVWQSGDNRQGVIFDIVADGKCLAFSDERVKVRVHSGYSALSAVGYKTQFMECYDSSSAEDGFARYDFDDSDWEYASVYENDDHIMKEQKSRRVTTEGINPVILERRGDRIFADFGKTYVGCPFMVGKGKKGECVDLYMGQELSEDGSVRYDMRCNCVYHEKWILSGGYDALCQYNSKAFRYLEIKADPSSEIWNIRLIARHYPFGELTPLSPIFKGSDDAQAIWELCTHSIKYGVQETIQDCMDREKGFYLGDGCYTAFAHMLLTRDDSMVRKLIDDAFASSFINEGLATCMSCSFIQKIAEYPLILPEILLWHYRYTGDAVYLEENVKKIIKVLDYYKERYEEDGILRNLDRWCVVEWPKNYRDGYAVDVTEGKICTEAHISINAYYYRALYTVNKILNLLGKEKYRDEKYVLDRIVDLFYDKEKHLFVDGEDHRNISLVGNVFPYAFDMSPDEDHKENFIKMLTEKGKDKTFFFTTFPLLFKYAREDRWEEVKECILHEGTWKRMLREGATTTFEGWGRDCKWNTSLFHLTMASAVIFMADTDLKKFIT